MSTEINVTVDSGGLLERSKLQAAANRQAFVEGQQRTKAEQTGKEQRLERLAAEGRDAQSNLILPNRARQSALDRFTPQPAARRNGVRIEGLILNADDTVRFEFLEEVGWFIFGGRYFGGIGPSYVFAPEESTGLFSGYLRELDDEMTSFEKGLEAGRFGERLIYSQFPPGIGAPAILRYSYLPIEARQLFNESGTTLVWDANTYAETVPDIAYVELFFTAPDIPQFLITLRLVDPEPPFFVDDYPGGAIWGPEGRLNGEPTGFPYTFTGPWRQQALTLIGKTVFVHVNGILLFSGTLSSMPERYSAIGLNVLSGSYDKTGLGTLRWEPRALFGPSNYAVKSVLKYR